MTAQSKTPAGYCLYHFSRLFPAKSFKTTTFLCEYLRCRIVRKHCKKFIAKVGSEIISRTTFLHLDTKWEWPTRLAKKQGSGRKLRVQKWRQSVGRQKKSPFSERKQKRKGCHMCSDARLHFSLYSVSTLTFYVFFETTYFTKNAVNFLLVFHNAKLWFYNKTSFTYFDNGTRRQSLHLHWYHIDHINFDFLWKNAL